MNYYGYEFIRESDLTHHGIKGQKWGIRRFQNEDGSLTPAGRRRTQRLAKKDAKEFARAKMYYGEGAGNRRKLIKATVNQRSKDIPDYKEEFERQLAKQDMAKHAEKAKHERARNTAAKKTVKTTRGVLNLVLHTGANVSAAAASAYAIAHYTGMDKKIIAWGRMALNEIPKHFS